MTDLYPKCETSDPKKLCRYIEFCEFKIIKWYLKTDIKKTNNNKLFGQIRKFCNFKGIILKDKL